MAFLCQRKTELEIFFNHTQESIIRIRLEQLFDTIQIEPERQEYFDIRLLLKNILVDWLGIFQLADTDSVVSLLITLSVQWIHYLYKIDCNHTATIAIHMILMWIFLRFFFFFGIDGDQKKKSSTKNLCQSLKKKFNLATIKRKNNETKKKGNRFLHSVK